MDVEGGVPLVLTNDLDLNKIWKIGSGLQVVYIDSTVGIISQNDAVVANSPISTELEKNSDAELKIQEAIRVSEVFHIDTSVVCLSK